MDIADVLNNLGDICRLQCKYDDAEDYFTQALNMKIKLVGEHDPRVADTTNSLGVLFKELKRFDEAEHNYTRALSIHRCTYKDDHMNIADCIK